MSKVTYNENGGRSPQDSIKINAKNKIMHDILKSASKIVLILVTGASIVGLFTGHISEETFKTAMLMVFTFYFASKGDQSQQFAGK